MPKKVPEPVVMSESEELAVAEAIIAARTIQKFLFGESDGSWGLDEWCRMLRKRHEKIAGIDPSHPHAAVELRKRLLQNAALSIALIGVISDIGVPPLGRLEGAGLGQDGRKGGE